MKLLDCTIRDGGYYTNWDFGNDLIVEYAALMESLPIEYIEVGYRSITLEGYLGKYYYCPVYVLEELKHLMPSKKLVIILNEKDIRVEHLEELLLPIKPLVSLVRMAVDPKNFERAIILAKAAKAMGFEVAFNVMYMSNWKNDPSFLNLLDELENNLDFFYMVDSFGGILPNEVKEIIKLVQSKTKVPLGFHGHDNLSMGLINSITALEEGCEIIDSTITGMGRGAGNLRTELLLTYLESQKKIKIDFKKLGNVVSKFEDLKKQYNWGTSLPYMFSGAYSLPQKDVMEWLGMNRYSLSSILNALNNKKLIQEDNFKLPLFKKTKQYDRILIIGGGDSVEYNKLALEKLFKLDDKIVIILVGVKNIKTFSKIKNDKFITLIGTEAKESFNDINSNDGYTKFIYGPFPRKMGISVPENFLKKSTELNEISFTNQPKDSLFAIACQLAIDLAVKEILMIGFDGYDTNINKNQSTLEKENQCIINDLIKNKDLNIFSLNPSNYDNLKLTSIYSLLK